MKHLKLFEQHEKLFWQIGVDEYNQSVYYVSDGHAIVTYNDRWVDFTDVEIKLIQNLLQRRDGEILEPQYRNNYKSYVNVPEKYKGAEIFFNFGNNIFINKIKDEWYFIRINSVNQRYKCDQWDGLISCLEYIKLNLINIG